MQKDEINKKQIINKVDKLEFISWDILKDFEYNNLKENNNRDVAKLVHSIKENGFIDPFDIWVDEGVKSEDGQVVGGRKYIFDGKGRELAIKVLVSEGYSLPDLPVLFVKADNFKQAKKFALLRSSNYGNITQESLYEFTTEWFPYEIDELKKEVNFYEFDKEFGSLEGFDFGDESESVGSKTNTNDEPDIDFDNIQSNENREKNFKEQLVTCPHCDGKFNMQI